MDYNQDECLFLITRNCQKLWDVAEFLTAEKLWWTEWHREGERQSMDHLLCPALNEKALLQMNKVLPKGSLQRPSLPLAWSHDLFNTQAACPPLLTRCLMAFLTQASFKLHFIAVVFLLFDSFLHHLSIKILNYIIYPSIWCGKKYMDTSYHIILCTFGLGIFFLVLRSIKII